MPELTAEEYDALKADIQERGVMVPIEFDEDGNCLDGHHRLRICQELGIKDYPTVIRAGWTENQKYEHALELNIARRHMTLDQQRAAIKKTILEHPEMKDVQIARLFKVSPTTVGTIRKGLTESGEISRLENSPSEYKRHAAINALVQHPEMTDRQIAKEIGVDHKTVGNQRKKMVTVYNPSSRDQQALKDPDIVRRMAETGSNVAGAIREQKRDQLVEHLESVETREAKAVAGVYDVVVIDPPWPMQKIERDVAPEQVGFDYPTMSIDEIKALKVPAADDCHIFLWTTVKFLFDAKDILDAWGFKYVCPFIWHKPGGFQPIGLPMYNIEICLYAHKGAPKFVDLKSFCLGNSWPTRGHSVKPEEFYELLRRVTAGRRLDMFNRRKIEGFDSWGKEAAED